MEGCRRIPKARVKRVVVLCSGRGAGVERSSERGEKVPGGKKALGDVGRLVQREKGKVEAEARLARGRR